MARGLAQASLIRTADGERKKRAPESHWKVVIGYYTARLEKRYFPNNACDIRDGGTRGHSGLFTPRAPSGKRTRWLNILHVAWLHRQCQGRLRPRLKQGRSVAGARAQAPTSPGCALQAHAHKTTQGRHSDKSLNRYLAASGCICCIGLVTGWDPDLGGTWDR